MSEKKYRVKTDKSVCYIGTKKECGVYLSAFVDGCKSVHLEVDGSVVKDRQGDAVLYMEEMKLPEEVEYTDSDGDMWTFYPDTEHMNILLNIKQDGMEYIVNLDVKQVEELKACFDAWLSYMKG